MSDNFKLHDQRKAALVNRWPGFFSWMAERYGFHLENVEPGKEQSCPVHGGNSGEAFRFFDDFELTGGGICNSGCIKMATGDRMVSGWLDRLQSSVPERYRQVCESLGLTGSSFDDMAGAIIDQYLDEKGIALPPPRVGLQVFRWINGIEKRIALKYLDKRGLTFGPHDLPVAVRGTQRYWAHPKVKRANGVMALVYGHADTPLTHQVILVNDHGEKLGKRSEDKAVLELLKDGKPSDPPIKRIGSLQQQEDLSFRYVPLGNSKSSDLLLGEGIETVLAGRKIFEKVHGQVPAARAMVGSPYQNQVIPAHTRRVFALIDNDHTVDTAQQELEYLASENPDVEFFMMVPPKWTAYDLSEKERKGHVPDKGKDWLDSWVRYGDKRCAELWGGTGDVVKATGIKKHELNRQIPESRSAKGSQASGPQSVRVSPVDRIFFEDLGRLLAAMTPPWYRRSDDGLFVVEQGVCQSLDREHVLAHLSENVRFVDFKSGNELPFPADRVRLWTFSQGYRRVLRRIFPAVSRVIAAPALTSDSGHVSLTKKRQVIESTKTLVNPDPIHLSAIRQADSWIDYCESNPELVNCDVQLISDTLSRYMRSEEKLRQPSALVRFTSVLMLKELVGTWAPGAMRTTDVSEIVRQFAVLVQGCRGKEESAFDPVIKQLFAVHSRRDSQEFSFRHLSAVPEDSRIGHAQAEALLAVLYLGLIGHLKYEASVRIEDFPESLMEWFGVGPEHLSSERKAV